MVLLIAHNGKRFDHKILRHHFGEVLGHPIPSNWCFGDSLPMAKELSLKSYSMANLSRAYLTPKEWQTQIHSAAEDVQILWKIMKMMFARTLSRDDAVRFLTNKFLKQAFSVEFQTYDRTLEEEDFEDPA